MKTRTNLLVGTAILFLTSTSYAGIVDIFNDKATFLGTTSATSITGPIPNSGSVGSTETLGDVTFSTTAFPTSSDIFFGQWSTLIGGFEIAISGSENLDVSIGLGGAVSSFGFDFHEPTAINQQIDGTNTPFSHESLFTIEIFNGAALVDSTLFDPVSDQLEFFGLTSDMGFDSVRITESLNGQTYGGGIDISNDNEFFGEFYAASPVPVPAAVWLFGTALIGLAGFSKRRKAA